MLTSKNDGDGRGKCSLLMARTTGLSFMIRSNDDNDDVNDGFAFPNAW